MSTNFNTENNTLRKLLGNGLTYSVPSFQRDYSWDEEQWDDLWEDILDVVTKENPQPHYMAYLVLQSQNSKNFSIIDGQQRLTTLSIIILSVLRHFKDINTLDNPSREDDYKRSEGLRNTYIGSLDLVTLISKTKLKLNRNNHDYYRKYIVTLERNIPTRGFRASEKLLQKASNWFYKKIESYIENYPIHKKGEALACLVEKMVDNLFFTVITVTDELNAYKVFETLNARGVTLSSTDLLKNYLFSIISKNGNYKTEELESLDDDWTDLSKRLENANFSDFVRCYWIAHHKFVRKLNLFKDIKETIKNHQGAFELLNGLSASVEIYMNLYSPDGGTWCPEAKEHAKILKYFHVKQFYCVVLAAHNILKEHDMTKLLRVFVVISFRYNVISSLSPNDLERSYEKIALGITNRTLNTLDEIIMALRDVYIPDDKFYSDFKEKTLNNNKIISYILSEIEHQKGGTKPSSSDYTIEHILPQKADENWNFEDSEVDAFVWRLGNMTLLEKGKNNKIGNDIYPVKQKIYKDSCFKMNKELAEKYSDWNIEAIEDRQEKMAKLSKTIWKISQYS